MRQFFQTLFCGKKGFGFILLYCGNFPLWLAFCLQNNPCLHWLLDFPLKQKTKSVPKTGRMTLNSLTTQRTSDLW